MNEFTFIQNLAIWSLPVLFAITVHEVAHGWVAKQRGDDTAYMLGRLTLNPLRHIDWVGTVIVPALLLAFGNMIFGWAKPVPVDWRRLRNPKWDMAVVAAAGPLANLMMAFAWALVIKLALILNIHYFSVPMIYMGQAGIAINLLLMLINLIPVPPLDGGRVLCGLLPERWAAELIKLEPFGLLILLVLLSSGYLGAILGSPYEYMHQLLLNFSR